MIQSDDLVEICGVSEAMQLTDLFNPFLSLCPIYHPRLCRFSESPSPRLLLLPTPFPHLFFFLFSFLSFTIHYLILLFFLYTNDRRVFPQPVPQHPTHSPKRQGMSSLQVSFTRPSLHDRPI